MVENFKVIDFVSSNSSIESNQKRLEEGFSSFEVEVHDLDPEEEGHEGTFHDPVDVNSGNSNTEDGESSPESDGEFSSNHKVFVVGRYLFWSDKIVEQFSIFHT